MSYFIDWHPNVRKFLQKLPKEISARIVLKARDLREEPFRYLEHYEGDYYKFRVGDYRALVDIDQQKKIVRIRYLDHRKKIYKQ